MDEKRVRQDYRLDTESIAKIEHIARAFRLTKTGALEYLINAGYEAERQKQALYQKKLEKEVKAW